jgi:predicted SAM-dependent methyltransferase
MILRWLTTKSLRDIAVYFRKKSESKRAARVREKIFSDYFKNNQVIKLQLGCGPFPMKDWLNTDLLFNDQVAFMDAADTYPLKDNSVDYIFTEHLFEHLTFSQEVKMLSECFRVLKKGGKIRIATPNLDFLLNLHKSKGPVHEAYIKNSISNHYNLREVKKLFKEEDYNEVFVISNFFRDWGHQIVHNFSSLELLLKTAGFSEITREQVGSSREQAFTGIEQHGYQITDEFNKFETIIVEARK